MYFMVLGTDRPGVLDKRTQLRPVHREYLRHHNHPVKVVLGGPTLDGLNDGDMNGTLLVIDAQDREAVNAYLADEPYCANDLFASLEIRPWVWGLGTSTETER